MPCKCPPEKKPPSRLSKARRAAFLCFWAGFIVLCVVYRDEITVENILSYTPEQPFLAALVLLLLFAGKSLSVVLYSGILYAAGGRMFPLPAALLVNSLGSAVMLTLPFFVGRHMGKEAMENLLEKNPKLRSLQSWSKQNEGFLMMFIRIIGLLPSDLVSMFFGASGVSYGRYLFWSLLGMLPSVITFTVMGRNLHDPGSPAFLIAAGCELAMMLLSLLVTIRKRKRHDT